MQVSFFLLTLIFCHLRFLAHDMEREERTGEQKGCIFRWKGKNSQNMQALRTVIYLFIFMFFKALYTIMQFNFLLNISFMLALSIAC